MSSSSTKNPHNIARKPLVDKGWVRVLCIVLPYIFVVGIFQTLGVFAAGVSADNVEKGFLTLAQQLVILIFNLAGIVFIVSLFTYYVDAASFKSIGFKLKGHVVDIILGVALGAIAIAIGFFCLLGLKEISVEQVYFDFPSLVLSFFLFVAVAFSEEIFLRGYILNNLMQSFNKYAALLVSSALFSIMHYFNPSISWIGFVNIFLAGILLGIPYIYTKNLWYPIAFHFSWNFFQGSIFGFNVSGQKINSLVTQSRTSDTILNGGAFGFEGSLLSVGILLVAILATWLLFKNRQQDIVA